MNSPLLNLIDESYPEAVRLRRIIHANPELSGEEFETAALVYEYLSRLGLTPRYYAGKTGVAARIVNGPGKTVVLRADMDALPIEEKNAVSFKSRKKGVMHACGHDMHTACLLAAAGVLLKAKESWKGAIVVLFQPSEEKAPGGALRMIREKAFPTHTDAVFGLHVSTDHVTGRVGLKPGSDYSGVLDFDVCVKGQGGHGATPHKTIDPIVCSCAIIMQLQTLISRESPSYEPAVLTVGSIHAGTRHNIIPDETVFSGTIRTFSDAHQDFLRRRVAEKVALVAKSFNAAGAVSFTKSYPPGHNDENITNRAARVLEGLLGPKNVVLRKTPTMFAEDFAYYQEKSPGLYVHLGVRHPGRKNDAGIHSARFLPDERALRTGIAVHAGLAIDILS
jgi:amidohydrolase